VEKTKKKRSLKKRTVVLPILIFMLIFAAVYVRAVFLNQPVSQNTAKSIELKYNDPLNLTDLPKFNLQSDTSDLPLSEYQQSDSAKVWLSVKTENYINIGYLDTNLKFNLTEVLPKSAAEIKVFEGGKLFFISQSENGSNPSLVFKNGTKISEIISLNPNEFFTGFYYSPQEKLFYISKGNSRGVYSFFFLKTDGSKEDLFETSQEIKVIKPQTENAIIKVNSECKSLNYFTKAITDFDCNYAYLNIEKLNIVPSLSQIKISNNGQQKVLYTAANGDTISNATYFNGNIYFTLNNSTNSLTSKPYKFLKVNLTGSLSEITSIMPSGEVDNLWFFKENLIINKYYGIERLMKLTTNESVSYPQSEWKDIELSQNSVSNIEILGPLYQI